MAASSSSSTSAVIGGLSAIGHSERLFVGQPRPYLTLPRVPFFRATLVFSRRRSGSSSVPASKKKKKKFLPQNDDVEDEAIDEDAFEALFSQLEEDLKKDGLSFDDSDDEISEEDLARLERELEEALGDDDDLSGMFNVSTNRTERDADADEEEVEEEEEEEEEEAEEEEEEERPLKLKNWQLRRLASALKIGRRKTSIKSLAAELCLDRAVVLELLREPPPNLLLMSAALPDEIAPTILEPETKHMEPSPVETKVDVAKPETKVKVPVHVMQSRWSTQKRLKKVHVETLERVYRRTKRPSNAMISSIVHVTNLPRKRVLKWFEDKRDEDGVPNDRHPYQRSTSKTVFTS